MSNERQMNDGYLFDNTYYYGYVSSHVLVQLIPGRVWFIWTMIRSDEFFIYVCKLHDSTVARMGSKGRSHSE